MVSGKKLGERRVCLGKATRAGDTVRMQGDGEVLISCALLKLISWFCVYEKHGGGGKFFVYIV